jgi:hypothetical protein
MISDAGDSLDEPIIMGSTELAPSPSSMTAQSLVTVPKLAAALHTLELEQALEVDSRRALHLNGPCSVEGEDAAECGTPTPTPIDATCAAGGATPTTRRATSLIERLTVSVPCGKGARLLDTGRFSGHFIPAGHVRLDIDRLRVKAPGPCSDSLKIRSRDGSDDDDNDNSIDESWLTRMEKLNSLPSWDQANYDLNGVQNMMKAVGPANRHRRLASLGAAAGTGGWGYGAQLG